MVRILLAAGIILVISFSCMEKGGKYIHEGEIHYHIDYIKSAGSISEEFKPKTLIVSFKNSKILFEILAPIGNQGIMNIVNPETEIYDTYINMLAVRYYYSGNPGENHPGFGTMAGMKIKMTDRTSIICGYTCNNAQVTFLADTTVSYDVWYTNDIKVKNSNISTPYSEIDGVLMSFYYMLGKSVLKFEAESVYRKDISDKLFERRAKYKLVSKSDMERIISSMVNL